MKTMATEGISGKISEFSVFFLVLALVFTLIFFGGNAISGAIESAGAAYLQPAFSAIAKSVPNPYFETVINGLYSGIVLGLGLVIAYIALFHLLFALLEESNFVARVSHDANFLFGKVGLSGRAVLPLLMGYGCTVPAVLGARAAKTEKERIAIGFLSLFLPCAARTSVILALIGAFLGPLMAIAVYAIDGVIVLLVGTMVAKFLGLKPAQRVFEKPAYKLPNLRSAAWRAYYETLEFVQLSLPWIVAGTVFVNILSVSGALDAIGALAQPLLATVFGLPPVTFIPFVFGVVRGELTLAMLAAVGKTTDFSILLTARQMLVFAIISIIYVPCLSTLAALLKEFGKKNTALIIGVNLVFTIILGALANAVLSLFIK